MILDLGHYGSRTLSQIFNTFKHYRLGLTVFQLLHPFVQLLQPFLVPVCFILAWTFAVLALWSVWTAMRDGITTGKRLHQIPCPNCRFFTGDYHLKCTVHPSTALTEEALDCSDYCPQARELYR